MVAADLDGRVRLRAFEFLTEQTQLHHAAFDHHILGIRPDLTVELSASLLRQADGPMLEHGLRGFHGARILVPHETRLRPNSDFLAERYELFRAAG
jgi:putative restriction endonuclease